MATKPRKTDARTLWIKARVRPEELGLIELRAAQANRTVSEYIRDVSLGQPISPSELSAYLRHRLNRHVVFLKAGASVAEAIQDGLEIIAEIDKALEK